MKKIVIEKVNPSHPDKIADRIGGALVDYAYSVQESPKVAVEVLIGHGNCNIIVESSVTFTDEIVQPIVDRIAGEGFKLNLISVPQDVHLAKNQEGSIKCGDNGIFTCKPLTDTEMEITKIAQWVYDKYPTDGKYILDGINDKLIVCQSHCDSQKLKKELEEEYPQYEIVVNPLGDWEGGMDTDTGCTNRKLGSDLGRGVSGGGVNAKGLTLCDVSATIYFWLKAQETGKEYNVCCAIGDTEIGGVPYEEIVKVAGEYINSLGGFEKFSEWGVW